MNPLNMKSLLIVLAIAATASMAHATECNDQQWQEATGNAPSRDGSILMPRGGLQYGNDINANKSALDLCIDRTQASQPFIRPISGADYESKCPAPGGGDLDVDCHVHWAISLNDGVPYCNGYTGDSDCVWDKRPVPTSFLIQVQDMQPEGAPIVCERNYSLPDCN